MISSYLNRCDLLRPGCTYSPTNNFDIYRPSFVPLLKDWFGYSSTADSVYDAGPKYLSTA